MYVDLSILPEKAIDLKFLLQKLILNGYSTFALDYECSDQSIYKTTPKEKPLILGEDSKEIKIVNRATLIIENNASLFPLGQQSLPYDIIAVKPLNQKIFHTLCTEHDAYDVMTFDIGNKLPFMLKRNPVYEAIRRGKFFQIVYDPLFDDEKRVICMTNIVNIIKATNGKNLIISSHVGEHSIHRTPFDIAALMVSLGLDKNKALECLKENPLKVILNAQHRKFCKGAIKQIPVDFGRKLSKRIQKHRRGLQKMKQMQKKQDKMQEQK